MKNLATKSAGSKGGSSLSSEEKRKTQMYLIRRIKLTSKSCIFLRSKFFGLFLLQLLVEFRTLQIVEYEVLRTAKESRSHNDDEFW